MNSEVVGIGERLKKARIGLKDALAIIDMALDDQLKESVSVSPYEVFEGLDELIEQTVHGATIERFRPEGGSQPFHTFEVHTEEGEILAHLNMFYLRKPIPCYYLAYAEVVRPFRSRGLGNKILKAFMEFVGNKRAVGLLDNIIPFEEPTYDMYTKLGWKRIGELIPNGAVNGEGNYMVFVPSPANIPDLSAKLIKLLFKLRKKRPVIEMHDNEAMVKRTIEEFRSAYEALQELFEQELSTATATPLMRFMFTKFVTKLLGFRRRIALLLGYTGGESLEQIYISDRIKKLPIHPYSFWGPREVQLEIWAEEDVFQGLPGRLKKEPTLFIERLPLYRRPYLFSWMERKEQGQSFDLNISDLLDLGFDPTRLREFRHGGVDYVFQRLSPHFLLSIEKKRRLLSEIAEYVSGMRFHNTTIQINPPLAILRHRGNVYILRKKVEGIHSEEALDQLRTSSYLKDMNPGVGIDRAIVVTINEVRKSLLKKFDFSLREEIEDLIFFVPWDLQRNIPRITVDISGASVDAMWLA